MSRFHGTSLVFMAALLMPAAAFGQREDPSKVIAAQRDAMAALSMMDGNWRGSAWMILPGGGKQTLTQTERVGSFLDGSVRVIEGRGYAEDGTLVFNAFGIVSHDPAKGTYTLRSYAQGRSGDFPLTLTEDGYAWEIPAGPMTIRYTATIKDGTWSEVGDRIMPGKDPVRFLEMNLSRVGDSTWPSEGALGPGD